MTVTNGGCINELSARFLRNAARDDTEVSLDLSSAKKETRGNDAVSVTIWLKSSFCHKEAQTVS
jgi:hypothetical protein